MHKADHTFSNFLKAVLHKFYLRPATLLKKRLWHRCFVNFLITHFSQNTSWRLLLINFESLKSYFLIILEKILSSFHNYDSCFWSGNPEILPQTVSNSWPSFMPESSTILKIYSKMYSTLCSTLPTLLYLDVLTFEVD